MASTCSHASCGCVIFIEELSGPHIVEKGKCMNCDHAVNLHPRKPAQGNTFFREHHLFSFIVLHFVCCVGLYHTLRSYILDSDVNDAYRKHGYVSYIHTNDMDLCQFNSWYSGQR